MIAVIARDRKIAWSIGRVEEIAGIAAGSQRDRNVFLIVLDQP